MALFDFRVRFQEYEEKAIAERNTIRWNRLFGWTGKVSYISDGFQPIWAILPHLCSYFDEAAYSVQDVQGCLEPLWVRIVKFNYYVGYITQD